ncbi:TPA-induced transmembrane protein isoform X1 [Ranitomeya variabilis]|uniref:TPA-induced transmembrane protein isoform X1 n=1 Tax=Ranitomeya variabilis TaxID=490064 RepID=UPI0040562983
MDPNQNHHYSPVQQHANNVENVQKKQKKKWFQNPKFWIVIIFLLLALVTISSLILYSNIYIDDDEKNLANLSLNSTCSYRGFVNVTNPCLWDSWIKNETLIQERITNLYSVSPFLNYFFIAAKVDYNSIIKDKAAVIYLDFKRPSKSIKYPISIALVEGILRQDMYELEESACQNSHISKNSLQVTLLSI